MRKIKMFSGREFVEYRRKMIRRMKITTTFIALMSAFEYFYIYVHTSALPMDIGLSIAWWLILFVSTVLCLRTPKKPTKMDNMCCFLNINFLLFAGILLTVDPQERNNPIVVIPVCLVIIFGFLSVPIEPNHNNEDNKKE